MSSATESAFWLVVVSGIWGCTNPLIKRGSHGIESVNKSNPLSQFLAELQFLFLRWQYLLPFLANQLGSVVYYITLASAGGLAGLISDITLAVPLTNSLTFIFTSITGKLLGEQINRWETYAGMALVVVGVSLCVVSKTMEGV